MRCAQNFGKRPVSSTGPGAGKQVTLLYEQSKEPCAAADNGEASDRGVDAGAGDEHGAYSACRGRELASGVLVAACVSSSQT